MDVIRKAPVVYTRKGEKVNNYKFSIVIPKCLFSRDVIIIVLPLPGAVTITTYLVDLSL